VRRGSVLVRTVEITIRPYGVHRIRGERAYKFSPGQASVLTEHGWRLVKNGTAYVYLAPPEPIDELRGGARVSIVVPDDESIESLAESCHATRKDWRGTLNSYPVSYSAPTRITTAHFLVGSYSSPWSVSYVWRNAEGPPEITRRGES
jgi:hypothetical protein